jgi:hypothetical protein
LVNDWKEFLEFDYILMKLLRFSVHSSASGSSFNYAPALTMTGEFSWCIWMAMSMIRSCILTTLPPSILSNKQIFSSILKIEWPLSILPSYSSTLLSLPRQSNSTLEILGCDCFPETIFQTFLCLFAIKKVG